MPAHASLGGVPFRFNPDAVKWTFDMKVSKKRTLGGNVIQVIGTKLGSMQVAGDFGSGDRAKGDREGWEEQRRFLRQVISWVQENQRSDGRRALEFVYAPLKWHFSVYVEAFASKEGDVEYVKENINPSWLLTLFIIEDRSRVVVDGIKDLYLKRLMNGQGWKQTDYNGGSQADVDALLGGRTIGQYLSDEADRAYQHGPTP